MKRAWKKLILTGGFLLATLAMLTALIIPLTAEPAFAGSFGPPYSPCITNIWEFGTGNAWWNSYTAGWSGNACGLHVRAALMDTWGGVFTGGGNYNSSGTDKAVLPWYGGHPLQHWGFQVYSGGSWLTHWDH